MKTFGSRFTAGFGGLFGYAIVRAGWLDNVLFMTIMGVCFALFFPLTAVVCARKLTGSAPRGQASRRAPRRRPTCGARDPG